jgi:DNA-directed RNA polymerase subunit M/transcription elongation factor TFIIS
METAVSDASSTRSLISRGKPGDFHERRRPVPSPPRCPVCDSPAVTVAQVGGSGTSPERKCTCDACGQVWSAVLSHERIDAPSSDPSGRVHAGRRPLNGSPTSQVDHLPRFVESVAIDTTSVDPCPKCGRRDGVEQEEQSGSSARWFVCARCGLRYTRLPPTRK